MEKKRELPFEGAGESLRGGRPSQTLVAVRLKRKKRGEQKKRQPWSRGNEGGLAGEGGKPQKSGRRPRGEGGVGGGVSRNGLEKVLKLQKRGGKKN